MNKKTLNIAIIVGVSGIIGYTLYKMSNPKRNTTLAENTTPQSPCSPGESVCPDGVTCYNPNITYFVNPCRNISSYSVISSWS